MGAVPRCCVGCCNPAGLIFIVTARPTMRGHCQSGPIPHVAPFSVKLSNASETAQVSSFASLSIIASRVIQPLFTAMLLKPKLETRNNSYCQYANPMPQPVAAGER